MTSESLTPVVGKCTPFCPRTRLRKFSVEELVVDERLQARSGVNRAVVRAYFEAMLRGRQFPALLVIIMDDKPYVLDGFHRLEAAKLAGLTSLQADTFEGSWGDGLEAAVGTNLTHGCRRTNADKRRAVCLALSAFADRSDKVIAAMCGVADRYVSKLRKAGGGELFAPLRTGRDGKVHEVRRRSVTAVGPRAPEQPTTSPSESFQAHADPSAQVAPLTTASTALTTNAKGVSIAPIQPAALVRNYVTGTIRHYPTAVREIEVVLTGLLAEIRSNRLPPRSKSIQSP